MNAMLQLTCYLICYLMLMAAFISPTVNSFSYKYGQIQSFVQHQRSPSRTFSISPSRSTKQSVPPIFPPPDDFKEKELREAFLLKPENMIKKDSLNMIKWLIPAAIGLFMLATMTYGDHLDVSSLLNHAVDKVADMGPMGYFAFALVYVVAELLAIPALPLTASSGYLFGLLPGTILVITSATIAASISFLIGRTYLRSWAQGFIQSSDKWRAIDRAIEREGFKVILLLRLSPLLPFALSNYLYAVTSVDFFSFITATFLGFTPGTFGYVYFGSAGKELFTGDGLSLPWYGYAAIGLLVLFIAQTVGQIATNAIKEMEEEDSSSI